MSDNENNQEAQIIQRQNPSALEPAINFYGHLVNIQKPRFSDTVFCSRFYTVNGFLCMENVKRMEKFNSSVEKAFELSFAASMLTDVGNGGPYFCIRRNTASTFYKYYYVMVPMRTMPSRYLDDSTSFRTENEAPSWVKTDKQTAQQDSDSATRENNQKIRERNREHLFNDVIPNYKIFIARAAYFKSKWTWGGYKRDCLNGKLDRWVEEYLKNNEIDFTPLKQEIEKDKIEFEPDVDWDTLK